MNRRDFIGTLWAAGFLHGCGGGSSPGGGTAVVGGAVGPSQPSDDNAISISSATGGPIYIAHRGSAALYPEETNVAYDNSLNDGQKWLECDVQLLHDGALGLMHDGALERTTTSAGQVSTLSASEWRALRIDANAWHGSNFGNDLAAPLFDEWVRKYKGKAILVPEDKDWHSMSAMVAVLSAAAVSRDQVLLQSFSLDSLAPAISAGYQTCYLHSGIPSPSSAVAAGIGWSGISANATDGDIQKWVSSGLKVLIWTVNRRSERDAKLKLGVAGFFSDDPTYVSSKLPLSAKDRFAAGTWAPGMFGNSGDFDLASRGEFFDGGYWGYSSTTPGYLGCLHGYLCPIKGTEAAKAYDISLTIRFDSATNNDPSRWASLFIGVDDRAFFDGAEVTNGYHILFRKNGSVEVFKKSAGARAALLVAASGTYIEDGRDASYRVTVTDATVKVARLGADGVELYAANARDVSYRGAYVHFGRNGLACRFNQITIS